MTTKPAVWRQLNADVTELERLGIPTLNLDDAELDLLCDMAAIRATDWMNDITGRLEERYRHFPRKADTLARVAFLLSRDLTQTEIAQRLRVSRSRVGQLVDDLREILDPAG